MVFSDEATDAPAIPDKNWAQATLIFRVAVKNQLKKSRTK